VTNLPPPDAEEMAELVDYLRDGGATEDEIAEALRLGAPGELALELVLVRGQGTPVAWDDVVAGGRLTPDDAARFWRALGFPDPRLAQPILGAAEAETLEAIGGTGAELFGTESILQFARVLGSAMALIAETLVDAFRIDIEVPQRDAGTRYMEIVRGYSAIADEMLPRFAAAMDAVLRRHIVNAARGMWAVDEERSTVTRETAVGFVDLVGYTATSRALTPRQLTVAVGEFDGRVSALISDAGGRLVKLIGDEAMFVVDDVVAACELALALAAAFDDDDEVPPVRVGLAFGPVVSIRADYYGEVVNLAARLVKAAEPSSAVVSASVRDAVGDAFDLRPLPLQGLKGFEEPVEAFVLATRRGSSA
jgi:adenylate cyclase